MFCRQCGTQNDDNNYKCTNCGQVIQQSPPAAAPNSMEIPTYLATSILVTILCCLPTGIVAIVYASQVSGFVASGRYPEAQRASDNAKTWSWVSAGLGILAALAYFIIMAGAFGAESNQ